MDERTVTIDIDEYRNLLVAAHDHDILLDAMYSCSTLSWDKKFLGFSDKDISSILLLLDHETYTAVFKLKTQEKNAAEAEQIE